MQHGDFGKIEVHLSKKKEATEEQDLRGGWHCEVSLLKEGWTESLICSTSIGMMRPRILHACN